MKQQVARIHTQPSQEMLPANTTPSHLLAMAVQQGADLEKLEKLMALQERWDANEARKAYVAAMAAFKAEPMTIGKNKHVSFATSKGKTEYDHAELSDVTAVVVPAMAKHGLSHRWTVKQENNKITVACVVTHALGHSESVEMSAPADDSGGKNTIQAIGSTKSYLERYTLLASVGMATGGQDDDGRGYSMTEELAVDPTWHDGIASAIDATGLKSLKAEMVTAFGSTTSIPKELIRAYNEKWAQVEA